MSNTHIPVMLQEAISALQVVPDAWYVDATFGGGGHTREILAQGGNVIAFDFDEEAFAQGKKQFEAEIIEGRLVLIRENFDRLQQEVGRVQKERAITVIHGILFDFGTNTNQLTSTDRGLSFQGSTQELDMRLDNRLGVKAKDLLALLSEKQLAYVFGELGGEQNARTIAKEIVRLRKNGRMISTVGELVTIVEKIKRQHSGKLHPATKVFQGLRIATNDELSNIERAFPQALALLKPQGTLVTIAFHEGEDRIAKQQFKAWEESGLGSREPKDAQVPTTQEVQTNPRSRSAKLRVFRKK